MSKLKRTRAAGLYRTDDGRFTALRSTRRAGEPGYRYVETGYELFDGDLRVGRFLSLARTQREVDKRSA